MLVLLNIGNYALVKPKTLFCCVFLFFFVLILLLIFWVISWIVQDCQIKPYFVVRVYVVEIF